MEEEQPQRSALDSLNARQQAFVLAYVDCMVGAEAVRRAGYEQENANRTAHQLLTNIDIKAAIAEVFAQMAMSSGEAIVRLSRWAAGSMGMFMDDEGGLDLSSEEAIEARHLIKKIKVVKRVERAPPHSGEPDADIISTEIELHDAKDAVKTLLQLHGKLIEKHEHSGPNGSPIKTQNDTRTWNVVDNSGGVPIPDPDE